MFAPISSIITAFFAALASWIDKGRQETERRVKELEREVSELRHVLETGGDCSGRRNRSRK
jgi:hypothetical protein